MLTDSDSTSRKVVRDHIRAFGRRLQFHNDKTCAMSLEPPSGLPAIYMASVWISDAVLQFYRFRICRFIGIKSKSLPHYNQSSADTEIPTN